MTKQHSIERKWRSFTNEISANYVVGYAWHTDSIVKATEHGTIILDTVVHRTAGFGVEGYQTRIKVSFTSKADFKFVLFHTTLTSRISILFGAQDIQIGEPEFDKAFVIRGNDERKIKALLADFQLQEILKSIGHLQLEITDREGYFGEELPKEKYELVCLCDGIIANRIALMKLYRLFEKLTLRFDELKLGILIHDP